jgi:hypothetical protein
VTEGDDVIGYKMPPRSTRYPVGVSGNPKGRPKRKGAKACPTPGSSIVWLRSRTASGRGK